MKFYPFGFGALSALFVSTASLGWAAPIPGLFNTGVGTNGALLAAGAIDPHYRLIQSADGAAPGPNAFVVNEGFPITPGAWLANGPASKWIGPMANQGAGNQPGDYTFRTIVDLTGLEPSTANVTFRWSSDNAAVVLLNGVSTGIGYDGNFTTLSSDVTLNSGFVDGTNALDFVVNNAAPGINPIGLRVEISGTADPVAPPGTPPSITLHPASQTNGLGESTILSVSVYGSRPLNYQWRLNGDPIPGATNASHLLNSISTADAGAYDVIVNNAFGTAISIPATLTVIVLSPAQLSYEPLGPSSRRSGLAFSEIMYHPADRADGRALEFIEIYNSNPFFEDLSGYRLSGAVDYTFPSNTVVAANSFLVVARVPADVQAVYGISGVRGPFTNNLPNDSGLLRLRKRSGAIVLEVQYSDEAPWPTAADGTGHSLVLARPSYGEAHPRAWGHSAFIGGSPGAIDPVPSGPLESVVMNELAAHLDDVEADFIELFNTGPLPVDISGCYLSDHVVSNKFRIPAGTIIAPRGFVVFAQFNIINDLWTNELGFALRAAGETVYFWNTNQTRVIEAIRWEDQGEDFSWGRYPDGSAYFFPGERTRGTNNVINRGAGAVLQQGDIFLYPVVINEIHYNPLSGDNDDEYVELHNFSSNAIPIGDWRLDGGVRYTFPSNTVIPANGFVVVAENATNLMARYAHLTSANTFGNWDGNLSNGGERLVLQRSQLLGQTTPDETDTTTVLHPAVDEVTYGTGGRWPKLADGGGSSLELIDPRSPWRLAANWAASDETLKSAWTTVGVTGVLDHAHPGVLMADQLQIMLQGAGEALVDDVEVFAAGGANRITNSTFEAGTAGWFFQGTHRLSYLEMNEGFNSARSLHLVASGRGDHVANRVRAPLSATLTAGMTVTIRAKVRWLRGHPEVLFRLRGNHLEAVGTLPVPPTPGTPGLANRRFVANAGPVITEVSHRPVLPQAGQTIRVTARVLDPDPLQSVTLKYRIDPGTELASLSMTDDGTGADISRGDGIYSAFIPAQTPGKLLAFHVEATDAFSPPAMTRFPADAPARECLVRVGDILPTSAFGTYRFWLTQFSHNFWAGREKMSNEDLDATFVYGLHRVVYNIGAHYSGSSYTAPIYNTPTGNLCGYDLNFPEDDLVLGEDHFTLDWPVRDSTDQREQLMFWFLEQYGLPNMYRRYVNLYVNGVKRGAIYDDVQQPDGSSVEAWFSDDSEGSLHKTDCWNEFNDTGDRIDPCILNTLENFISGGAKKVARYRWNWRPRATHGTANDFSDLFALVDAVNTQGALYQTMVQGVADVEHWMRTFAMNDLASYWDGFGNPNAKNTYLYKPERDTWKLLCWDFDVGLGVFNDPTNAPLFDANVDPTIVRMYTNAAFVRLYWQALDEAVNGFFQSSAVDPILGAKFAAFQASGIGLTSPFVPSGAYGLSISAWITQRRSFLLTQLATNSAGFAIIGTNSFTTNRNLVTLSGTAPIRVHTIVVNGVPYPAAWTSITNWTIRIPVTSGTNVLNLVGLDRFGNAVPGATRTVTVNYTGGDESPADSVAINEIMYNPAIPEASYVEIFNTSAGYSFNLSNWRLNGLDFVFAPGTIITNGQFLVIAKSRKAFAAAYGAAIPVLGEFDGQLDDGGETLTLIKPGAVPALDVVVDRVSYDDDPPWPAAADGQGSSLQLIDARQDNNRVSNWSDGSGWRFFSFTGNVGGLAAPRLFLFLNRAADVYIDNISLVAGSVPEAGPNLLANGDFEGPLTPPWGKFAEYANSDISTQFQYAGNGSLHIVAAGPGSPSTNDSVWQDVVLVTNTVYTLSYWYLTTPTTNILTARLNSSYRPELTIRPVFFTPGAANSTAAPLAAYPPLWLSEVQPENLSGVTDNFGETEPWLEIYNGGAQVLNLEGHFLSDNFSNLTQWAFPAGAAIQPGQYLLVWADGEPGETAGTNYHTSFRLNPTNGVLALSRSLSGAPQILDYLRYAGVGTNRSYGSYPDGQLSFRQLFYFPTPRGTNNPAAPPVPIKINEWMAANANFVTDPADGDFEDWFELYNPTTNTVDLGGYTLTDTFATPRKFIIPPGMNIAPRGFLVVWADEEAQQTATNADLHVNFRLSADPGEIIGLYHSSGQLIDAVNFGLQTNDISQGRWPDGQALPYHFMTTPTPGGPNVVPTPPEIRIVTITVGVDTVTLNWSAQAGQSYRVQYKNDLGQAAWNELSGEVLATSESASKTDTTLGGANQRFYRIIRVP